MAIRLIIFDLDGTIIDAYPAITRSFNFTLQSLGLPRRPSLVIRRAVGRGDECLLEPFVNKEDLPKALRLYRRHHRQALLGGSRSLAGVRGLLRRLKARGYKLAVASNRPTSFSYLLLRHLKLRKYFNYVLCADRLKRGKPHPEIIRRILERFSLQPGEALLVGDMVVDILAGRRAGVKTALVCGGSSPLEEAKSHKPDFILRKVSSLLRMINSLS